MYSEEHLKYIKNLKKEKIIIFIFRLLIVISFLGLWQLLVSLKVINSFIFSSPINIFNTIISLIKNNNFFTHIYITIYEVLLSFIFTTILKLFVINFLEFNVFFY